MVVRWVAVLIACLPPHAMIRGATFANGRGISVALVTELATLIAGILLVVYHVYAGRTGD